MKSYIDDGTEFRRILGSQFWKWCLTTAQESGFDAEVDDIHQNIRVMSPWGNKPGVTRWRGDRYHD